MAIFLDLLVGIVPLILIAALLWFLWRHMDRFEKITGPLSPFFQTVIVIFMVLVLLLGVWWAWGSGGRGYF
jgi:p-aminobenzoyl-glutamate transporter AbgT